MFEVNKKIVLSMVIVLTISLAFAISLDNLIFMDLDSSDSSGSASIISVKSVSSGLNNVRININLDNLDSINDQVYEAWLVDLDSEYKLSLGSFIPNTKGHQSFLFKQKINGFRVYDKLVITREDLENLDPLPAEAIMSLEIPGSERHIFMFNSNLSGSQEVPSTNSSASGFGEFILNTNENTLRYNISISNLIGNEIGSHIHGFSIVGNNSEILHNLPLGNLKIGVWDYSEEDESGIFNNMTYVNIHTDIFPGGEIRGQIVQVS